MRNRLIELLKKAYEYASGVCTDYDEAQEVCANFLIAEGVIVPPVKIGQTVYRIRGNYGGIKICKDFVSQVNFYHGTEARFWGDGHPLGFTADDIGKTVFLTREEAKKALAERSKG